MLRDITFGQYYESHSLIHKTDPRVKIVLLFLLIIFIFLAQNGFALGFAAASVLIIMLITKIPFKLYLKNMKAILNVLIFTAVFFFFNGAAANVLYSLCLHDAPPVSVSRAIFMAVRITLLIFISSALTYTTTPNDLTDAIERL